MALSDKEKKILDIFIEERIKSNYGIVYGFKVSQDKELKTKIKKERHAEANQYLKKKHELTWWNRQIGSQKQKPTLIYRKQEEEN
ncbi:MAG: hypothetical protein COC11_02390 [Candidatus Neomarinimicrobiota bacterium]|jgi:hypothetical protein|nr:MAG: hypothetical protein COC11_02390 [Candidatus Neomarinimicrobiota bacterium]